ncbi:hypothetical protein TVAG_018490 [Trichomonas vaginalis G3]|uniref:Uncharacterized protein n=1 Tax=Trichomonas vaginalis (strain ATCC PRA-98 / G3) TaxID=412133 RepID=A2F9Y5_TRIV3|nr:hypothetical protein TVAGG3_0506360 [Trichomonas vaginalis G3]EAX98313.1 hypothetical protein TVAG_018490 [Trichomonas vaginalis G3]KAI5517451.1 hypothetical protein TVAGG3_0506360 [Trichomonas vaginalis G3]|eukprot:XP_001311243.1 hypothetical protein [Trichomonas vaginalis G3]
METWAFNVGCGLIASAPVAAGHFILGKQMRYIVLAWLCAFVATIVLVLCSLSALFIKEKYENAWKNARWYTLLYCVPFEAVGKCLIKFFACRQSFLRYPSNRASIGLACGIGFSLAHILCLYYPMLFDQSLGIDITENHSKRFPNALDLAIGYHAASVFQIGVSLFLLRFANLNIFIAGFLVMAAQFGFSAISIIQEPYVKDPIMVVIGYLVALMGAYSYRSMKFEELVNQDDKVQVDD